MYYCARCGSRLLKPALLTDEGDVLAYGRRCAEVLGLLIPQPRRRKFHRRPRRDARQLSLEASA